MTSSAALAHPHAPTAAERALMAACRVIAADTGENSGALYLARKEGFVSVAAHVAARRAKREAEEMRAAAERAARNEMRAAALLGRTPAERVIFVALSGARHRDDLGPVMLPATLANIARREELRSVDPTNTCASDVYYVRDAGGRVTRW